MKAQAYNVEALEKLLSICTQSGASYQPSNASIEPTALTALLEEARKSFTAVDKARDALKIAKKNRDDAFKQVPQVGSKIVSFAEAGDFGSLKDLKDLNRKLRSQPFHRTVPKSGSGGQAEQSHSGVPSTEAPARKNRQLGFASRVGTLASMVSLVESAGAYAPREAGFTIAGLKAKLAMLQALQQAVVDARVMLNHVRDKEAELFFQSNGIYGAIKKVKRYYFAAFGRKSVVGKDIGRIKFKSRI